MAQLEPYFPRQFTRYFEPFVGGGAVFFHLWSTGRLSGPAYLFDGNDELINAYRVVREQVDELSILLGVHQSRHSPDYYYLVRDLDRQKRPLGPVERAARTIYLNRTCYNGLYRVNSKGQFNAPLGRYVNPKIVREDVLRRASAALQAAHLAVCDLEAVIDLAQPGDLFYFDPPYDPVSKTANFTTYTAGGFRDQDQRRLAEIVGELTRIGCLCMVSNSYTPFILELYRAYSIHVVTAGRTINSNCRRRGAINEVLILNYGID